MKKPGPNASTFCVLCGGELFQLLFGHHHGWNVARCIVCGMVQVMPRPTAAEVAALYDADDPHFAPYREQIEVHRTYFRKKITYIARVLPGAFPQEYPQGDPFLGAPLRLSPAINVRLLDVGCAMGVMLEEAKQVGWRAEGIDLSAAAVAACRKKGFTVYQGSLSSRPGLVPGRYDVVTAFEVIEHEREPLVMMRRIHQILKKGGMVVVTTPGHGSWWRKLMGKWWPGYQHPEHLNFFDEVTLTRLLHEAGFRDVTVKRDDNRPFPLSFLFTRAADYFPWFGWLLRPMGTAFTRGPLAKLVNPVNPWADIIAMGYA